MGSDDEFECGGMRGTAKGGKENLGGKGRAVARSGKRAIVGHRKGATNLG